MEIEWKSGGIFRISRPSINFWKIAIGKYSGNTENPYEMHKTCFLILPLPIKIVKICWVWTCFLFFIHLQINSQTLLLNVSLVKNICKQTNRDLLNKMCKNFLWNNLLASYKSPVYFTAATHLNAQWSWFRVCTHIYQIERVSVQLVSNDDWLESLFHIDWNKTVWNVITFVYVFSFDIFRYSRLIASDFDEPEKNYR